MGANKRTEPRGVDAVPWPARRRLPSYQTEARRPQGTHLFQHTASTEGRSTAAVLCNSCQSIGTSRHRLSRLISGKLTS